MFGDGPLTFREFASREPLPLARVHDAVLEFLRGRDDAVLFGAHAVNAYVDKPRMTEDVDIVSTRAGDFAEEVRAFLQERFHITVQVREAKEGAGYRLCQVRESKERHLVDVRAVKNLPPTRRVRKVLVASPPELIASKTASMVGRPLQPTGSMDRADVYRLLLAFPELKIETGPVLERLQAVGANEEVMTAWKDLVAQKIEPEDDDAGY